MKVLFVASECAPYIKTGGLADVIGTLPNALAKLGMDVRVIVPKYRDIPDHWKEQMQHLVYFHVNLGWRRQYCGIYYLERNDVTYYFIENEFYFGRDSVYGSGQEEGERFGFFCRAVLECLPHVGFHPDLIHCNDWQTGMVPALLKIQYGDASFYQDVKTIYTIHNLRYQGIFAWSLMSDLLGLPDRYFTPDMLEYYGCASFMKGGLVFADHITTVSSTYATEIQTSYFGERLDGMIRARSHQLTGILNGIDPLEYNPENDMWLPAHFSIGDLDGKAACKADIQQELGLDVRADVPVIAMVTRLVDQKGLDLVECVLDDIMRNDIQLIVLGKGDEHYQELFSWASWRYQGRLATRIEINNPMSHRIYAGADMVLIPSQFEPCGLTQMLAMRFGTIPIVRETGGLKDSVQPYNQYTNEGNGFSFANYNAHEMLFTLQRAIGVYHDKNAWAGLIKRAMETDFSWDRSAKRYAELYDGLVSQRGPEPLTEAAYHESREPFLPEHAYDMEPDGMHGETTPALHEVALPTPDSEAPSPKPRTRKSGKANVDSGTQKPPTKRAKASDVAAAAVAEASADAPAKKPRSRKAATGDAEPNASKPRAPRKKKTEPSDTK